MLASRLIGSGGEVDPLFSDVKLLTRFDGPSGVVTASQVRDFSRYRRVAQSVGAGTSFGNGFRNQALGLAVASDRVEFADDANLRLGSAGWTIEAIVKRGATSGTQSILSKGVHNSSGFDLRMTGSGVDVAVEFRFGASSVLTAIGPSSTPPLNPSDGDVWYYIQVNRKEPTDGAPNSMELNIMHLTGAYQGQLTGAAPFASTYNFNQTSPLYIGVNRQQATPMPSTGAIDEIRITGVCRFPSFSSFPQLSQLRRPFPGK
jgi:peptidoglycan hydrolase-like protein with peptidoglycan-binding domain